MQIGGGKLRHFWAAEHPFCRIWTYAYIYAVKKAGDKSDHVFSCYHISADAYIRHMAAEQFINRLVGVRRGSTGDHRRGR